MTDCGAPSKPRVPPSGHTSRPPFHSTPCRTPAELSVSMPVVMPVALAPAAMLALPPPLPPPTPLPLVVRRPISFSLSA